MAIQFAGQKKPHAVVLRGARNCVPGGDVSVCFVCERRSLATDRTQNGYLVSVAKSRTKRQFFPCPRAIAHQYSPAAAVAFGALYAARGGLSGREIARRASLGRELVRFQLEALSQAGIVERRRDGWYSTPEGDYYGQGLRGTDGSGGFLRVYRADIARLADSASDGSHAGVAAYHLAAIRESRYREHGTARFRFRFSMRAAARAMADRAMRGSASYVSRLYRWAMRAGLIRRVVRTSVFVASLWDFSQATAGRESDTRADVRPVVQLEDDAPVVREPMPPDALAMLSALRARA